jgi:hypothetical protein
MRMAWGEARRGETENWTFLSPEHKARCLERQLVTLQYDDRRTIGALRPDAVVARQR